MVQIQWCCVPEAGTLEAGCSADAAGGTSPKPGLSAMGPVRPTPVCQPDAQICRAPLKPAVGPMGANTYIFLTGRGRVIKSDSGPLPRCTARDGVWACPLPYSTRWWTINHNPLMANGSSAIVLVVRFAGGLVALNGARRAVGSPLDSIRSGTTADVLWAASPTQRLVM